MTRLEKEHEGLCGGSRPGWRYCMWVHDGAGVKGVGWGGGVYLFC